MNMLAQSEPDRVIIGVDTHGDVHVAVAIDLLGRRIESIEIEVNRQGYSMLVEWAMSLGDIDAFGIEGTNSYGAGLARHLRAQDYLVIEVNCRNRQARRRRGKSDIADAEAAARAVLAGEATAVPKAGNDHAEMIRILRAARVTAMKARTQAVNTLRSLIVTAPSELREMLHGLTIPKLIAAAAQLATDPPTDVAIANRVAMRGLASRYQALDAEIEQLDKHLDTLTQAASSDLRDKFGVGPDVAGALIAAVGDNPERIHSEPAFAMLCGAGPVEASSGKTTRHRLNRGGNRQANAALYRIALVRLRWHEPTKQYAARRTAEGLSKREIIRCIKRYIARELYPILAAIHASPTSQIAT